MTKMHLHVYDTETGQWKPGTVSSTIGAVGGGGGGGSTASNNSWFYAAASGGVTDTNDVTLVAAPGAGNVNYLTSLQLRNADASVATEVVIKSGSTVLWRIDLDANSPLMTVNFAEPIRATANTALTAAAITTSSETYINAQGYTALDAQRVEDEYGTSAVELYSVAGDRICAADASTEINISD